jgi:hypothetical protein
MRSKSVNVALALALILREVTVLGRRPRSVETRLRGAEGGTPKPEERAEQSRKRRTLASIPAMNHLYRKFIRREEPPSVQRDPHVQPGTGLHPVSLQNFRRHKAS